MNRSIVSALLIVWFVTTAARANNRQTPDQLRLEGGAAVPLAAHARRTYLLDTVPLYDVAVYADDRARLGSPDVGKALRIEITHVDDLRRQMPLDWRRELVPPLEPAGAAHLNGTLAGVRQGDVIVIEYVPARGTTVRVNKAVAATGVNHDLMLAFLDHWLGQRPVSEELKAALLASS